MQLYFNVNFNNKFEFVSSRLCKNENDLESHSVTTVHALYIVLFYFKL